MNETTSGDRRLPAALADLARTGVDYADGDGIDFEPYDAFDSAEETTDWLRQWTGNPELDGDAYRIFGQDGTGGLAALWHARPGVAEVRYPKKVRDLKKLEAEAVELGAYNNSVVHGLLQIEEYARAIFNARRPGFTEDEVEQQVAARLARQEILDLMTGRRVFSFVQCESTLRRPIGGRMVLRRQLERLLEVAQLRNVDLQVLPLDREENSGTDGSFRLLRLKDGATVAFSEAPLSSRVMTDPKETTVLDMRYGVLRAQALSPRDSLAFIEKVWGETRT